MACVDLAAGPGARTASAPGSSSVPPLGRWWGSPSGLFRLLSYCGTPACQQVVLVWQWWSPSRILFRVDF
jgi:hypothetical protein